jgi:hypothetical protein
MDNKDLNNTLKIDLVQLKLNVRWKIRILIDYNQN